MKTTIQKGKENKFYITILLTTILLSVVFFTSKLWMYDDDPIMQTPFHTNITGLSQTTLMLTKWEYNPKTELMEITLERKHTGNDVIKPAFNFVVKQRGEKGEHEAEVVFEDEKNTVLVVQDMPSNYRTVGLFVYEHRDKQTIESELREQLSYIRESYSDEEQEEMLAQQLADIKPSEKIIVGDYRKIKVNESLIVKDEKTYEREQVDIEISKVERSINSILEEDIPLQETIIDTIQSEVERLINEQEHLTSVEKEDAENEIKSNEDKITQAEKDIETMQERVKMLSEKRLKLIDKRNSILDKEEI